MLGVRWGSRASLRRPRALLGSLEQLEHVAAPVPNDRVAGAGRNHDHRGWVDWLATRLADRFLLAAHTTVIGRNDPIQQCARCSATRMRSNYGTTLGPWVVL